MSQHGMDTTGSLALSFQRQLKDMLRRVRAAHIGQSRDVRYISGQAAAGSAEGSGEPAMQLTQARQFIGRNCSVTWTDRTGAQQTAELTVKDLLFVSFYGAYLVSDSEELNLDKISNIQPVD